MRIIISTALYLSFFANANALDLSVFEKNSLFKPEHKQPVASRTYSRLDPAFWIKVKSRTLRINGRKVQPYFVIEINERDSSGNRYNDEITISDTSDLTEEILSLIHI